MKYHCLRFIVRKRQTTSAFFSSSCSILFNEHKDSNLYNSQSRIGSNSHIKCSSLMCVKNRLSKHSFEEEKNTKIPIKWKETNLYGAWWQSKRDKRTSISFQWRVQRNISKVFISRLLARWKFQISSKKIQCLGKWQKIEPEKVERILSFILRNMDTIPSETLHDEHEKETFFFVFTSYRVSLLLHQESHNGGKNSTLHFVGAEKCFETRGFVYALTIHVKNWLSFDVQFIEIY